MKEVESTTQHQDLLVEPTEEEIHLAKELKALELMEKLQQDGTQYEVHVELIETLKQVHLSSELENARLAMHEVYPLSEGLWLDWINDAKKAADTQEGRARLINLYKEAQEDYLSIKIWKSYVEYILEEFHAKFDDAVEEDTELIESTRKDLLVAVRATQFHIKQSQEIWKPFAEFELEVLNKFKHPEQQKKVKQLFLSRLAVLHIDYQDTFDSFSSFISTWDNSNYEETMKHASKIYSQTKSAAEERDLFEMKIVSSGYSLDAFYEYIENEKISKFMTSVNNVRCLYERAIVYYCTDPALWDDYILYLIEKGRVASLLNTATLRAIRNCPWSGTLYSHRARLLESENATEDEMNVLFDAALGSKLLLSSIEDLVTLLLAKIDHVRRTIDWEEVDADDVIKMELVFMESLEYLEEAFPDSGDPYYRIEKYYALMCKKRLYNVDKARNLWETIANNHGRDTEAWIQYISFERDEGDFQACETLFKKAMQKNVDNPARLIDAWNSYEREVGTIETYEKAAMIINRKIKGFSRQWQASLAEQEKVNEAKEKEREETLKRKKGLHRMEQKRKQKEKKAANPTEFKKPFESSNNKTSADFKKPREATRTKQHDFKKPVAFVKPGQESSPQPEDKVITESQDTPQPQETNQTEETTQAQKIDGHEEGDAENQLKRKASDNGLNEEDAKKHKPNDTEKAPAPKPMKAFNPRPRATKGLKSIRERNIALPASSVVKKEAHETPKTTEAEPSSKSNDDFRNLFLGKK